MATPSTWIKRALLIAPENASTEVSVATRKRYITSASFKMENSAIGNSFEINPIPQFTRWADIRVPPRGQPDSKWKDGMGRYHSEALHDNRQLVHMTFGVPTFNSLSGFFTNFYDSYSARLANTGRINQAAFLSGSVMGFIATLPLQPFIYASTWAPKFFGFLSGKGGSKWYYFKPTMHTFWTAVNNIANILAVNLGIAPRLMGDKVKSLKDPKDMSAQEAGALLHKWLPELFREEGGIDVMSYAIAAQRRAYRFQERITERREQATTKSDLSTANAEAMSMTIENDDSLTAETLFNEAVGTTHYQGETDDPRDASEIMVSMSKLADFAIPHLRDGSQFVTMRVEHNSSQAESFSNSTRESTIAQALNSTVQNSRSIMFNLAGGNTGLSMVDTFTAGLADVAAGAMDSVNLSGMMAFAGQAFVDFPKIWDSSTASLPKAEYTIPLVASSGNPISIFTSIYIPIAIMLAAALPLSAGKSAHTSPFLCQLYHTGRVQCKNGLITDLTIERGNGNVGWNAEGKMLSAQIRFSVVDLNDIITVPIKANSSDRFSSVAGIIKTGIQAGSTMITGSTAAGDVVTGEAFDEESQLQDYLAVLGGLPVTDSYYKMRRLNLNLTYLNTSFRNWKSPTNFFSWLLDGGTARTLSNFANATDRFAD